MAPLEGPSCYSCLFRYSVLNVQMSLRVCVMLVRRQRLACLCLCQCFIILSPDVQLCAHAHVYVRHDQIVQDSLAKQQTLMLCV